MFHIFPREIFLENAFVLSSRPREQDGDIQGVLPMLAMCFTGLFIHGVLPPSMISVVLVPIVKNKRISICSKNNYRPIALASIMSKLLEKIIYERVSEALETCSNQFGFKAKHSTAMCILAFKEAILKYRDLSSNVYTCFFRRLKGI